MSPLAHKFAKQECAIHSIMKHDNIVKLYNYTESQNEFILFMEYCDQQNYLSNKILDAHTPIKNNDKLISYSLDVLEGLNYIHSNNIIHDDIKLENILMQTPEREDEYRQAKLCDFGLSQMIDPQIGKAFFETKCGTIGYIAPELKQQDSFGTEIDMWSFGVCLYEMAVAYKPTKILNYKYGSGPIPYRRVDWKNRGKYIQNLISLCLEINPKKRITAQEALQHPWFEEEFINQ